MKEHDRRLNRLKNYDYSRNGLYFITICTKDRIPYLSDIIDVGDGVLDVPTIKLTDYGKILNDQIIEMNEIYKALIAYSLNLQEITPEIDAKLDEVINYYFDNDTIVGIVNTDIVDKAYEILFDNL